MQKYLRYTIPSMLTLIRIVFTVVFINNLNRELTLEVKEQSISYCAVLFFTICATDFVDGKVARYLKVTTVLGTYFDVFADFTFILSSTMLLVKFDMIPLWFIIVIIVKLIEFIVTSKIINKYGKERTFVFDYLGRIAAMFFYALPFTIVLIHRYTSNVHTFVSLLLVYLNTSIAIFSFIGRIIKCIQIKRKDKENSNKYFYRL